MKFKVTLLLFIISKILFGQIDDTKFRINVLKENIVGKEFTFGECDEKGGTETLLTYLGNVKTKKGKTYKIVNSIWTWGISCRATTRILIFNENNEYVGNYYLFDSCDLPTELKNGFLIISNKKDGCERKTESKININNGLPKSILGYNFES
jgi:hypothetical protein